MFNVALSTWIPKDRFFFFFFCFSLAMDTNRSDFGAVEDLMLSSNRHDLDSLLPHLDLTLYTTPKLPMDMPLDLWTLKLNLNWINRSSTLFCFFFFWNRSRSWIIVVLSLRLFGVWFAAASGFMDFSIRILENFQ